MNITRHNCESFFLDYYEKTLSPVEVAEVLFFLEENPDLKEIFEGYEAIFLKQEKLNFPDKGSLKKKYKRVEMDLVLSSGINKTNYERFFIASMEGMLSKKQAQELNSFLDKHPELKKDFELFQKCKLTVEPISFDGKEQLKKETITVWNREEYFVRAIEKDLNAAEQEQLLSFLKKNPEYNKEFALFKKTILGSEVISFEFKSQLKKRERKPVIVPIFFRRNIYYAAAAAVLLFAGLFLFFGNNDKQATYLADKNISSGTKVLGGGSKEENGLSNRNTQIENEQEIKPENHREQTQLNSHKNLFVSNEQKVHTNEAKKEKGTDQPAFSEEEDEAVVLIIEKAQEKELILEQVENSAIAENTEMKTDSIVIASVQNEVVTSPPASPVILKKTEEYQTVAAFLNKKVRSVLGIEKSTECETSDKINLWDIAMVAKKGLQRIIGTNTLDVNKVCEGSGEVEYIFVAGNFEITKSAPK